jgi:hypothetical protein
MTLGHAFVFLTSLTMTLFCAYQARGKWPGFDPPINFFVGVVGTVLGLATVASSFAVFPQLEKGVTVLGIFYACTVIAFICSFFSRKWEARRAIHLELHQVFLRFDK